MKAALMFLLLAACTSAPKTAGTATAERERLFPFGTYRHKVELKAGGREFGLVGVVELRAERVQVVGLSAFGTTEFRIVESVSDGKIAIEIFREQLKKFEPRILEYYSVLRSLFRAKMKRETETDLVWAENAPAGPARLLDPKNGSEFKIFNYDSNAVPLGLEISHPKFSARIKVTGYEI